MGQAPGALGRAPGRSVAGTRPSAAGGAGHSVHLHGRDPELAALVEMIDLAGQGRGRVSFVEGEAGIGKTRLVTEALAAAERQGFQVFCGRCEQLERLRPFAALVEAFGCTRGSPERRSAAIARLVAPEPEEAGDATLAGTLQYRAVESFLELIEHLAVAGPVALTLEDLHWADHSTLLTTRALARRVPALPVVVLTTLRTVPATLELTALVESCVEDGALHLRLAALATEPVHDLAAEVLGAPPGSRLRRQLAGAAGNPLFVIELARALAQEHLVNVADGCAEVGEVQAPPTLRLTILRRLKALSEPTLELLRLGAVLGRTFSLADLATVLARPAAELLRGLDEARRAGVLTEAGARLAFRHDLVHEALYNELALGVRAGLHRDVARALAAAGASALQVAQHLLLGASPGDAQAVDWLRRAAKQAAPRAPALAGELLARAAELSDPSAVGHDLLVAERVTALLWSGRVVEAEALAAEVLGRAHDPAVEGLLRLARARALFIVGRIQEGLQVLEAGEASHALASSERAQFQADRSYGKVMLGQLDEAERLAQSARETAEASDDDLAWCVATSASSLAAFFRGDLGPAIDLARAAVGRAETSPSPLAHRYPVHYFLAVFLLEADRFGEADEVVVSGRRMNEEWGSAWVLPMLEWVAAARRLLTGHWEEAMTFAEAGLTMAGEKGSRQGLASAQGLVNLITAYASADAGSDNAVPATGRRPEAPPSGVLLGLAGVVHGLLAEAQGCPRQALAALEECWARATHTGAVVDYRLLGPELVRLALATGAVERAEAVTIAVEEVAGVMCTSGAQGAALRCRGLADADADVLLASVAAYARAGRPVERAFALEEAGAALAASGRRAEAAAALKDALGVYEGLGATLAVARLAARLRAVGVRRGRRGPRQRPQEGWEALTASEQRVVALVAEGLTNAQIAKALFVSRHTVESHVSHVFTKLGVASRTELAARAVARGLRRP
jgi:DNA-binding NarL/FixJ family response regulator